MLPAIFARTAVLATRFLAAACILWVMTRPVAADGTVDFCNLIPGAGLDAPVLDSSGTPLGDQFLGQLYAAAPGGSLGPVGVPVRFRNHPQTGAGTGYVFGGTVVIPGIPDVANGSENLVPVQLRVWPARDGNTYEAAVTGGSAAASTVISVLPGSGFFPLAPPAPLSGLQGFRIPGRFALSLNRVPAAGGTIEVAPLPGADNKYPQDAVVNLTAHPAPGYVFAGWSGAASGSSPATSVIMAADRAATANFRTLQAGSIQFTQAEASFSEAGGTLILSVTRTGGSDGAVSAKCQLAAGGSATLGSDFMFADSVVAWADGESGARTISVPIIDDHLVEATESIRFQLVDPTGGAVLGSPKLATANLLDDDHSGALQFERVAWWGTLATSPAAIVVNRIGGTAGAVSVAYRTANGTATAPADYTAASGRLSWADGDGAPKSFSVPIKAGGAGNPQTVELILDQPLGGATVGNPGRARLHLSTVIPDAWLESFAGVYVHGTVGQTYEILGGSKSDPVESWPVVGELTLTKPVDLWIDQESPVHAERLYRYRAKVN